MRGDGQRQDVRRLAQYLWEKLDFHGLKPEHAAEVVAAVVVAFLAAQNWYLVLVLERRPTLVSSPHDWCWLHMEMVPATDEGLGKARRWTSRRLSSQTKSRHRSRPLSGAGLWRTACRRWKLATAVPGKSESCVPHTVPLEAHGPLSLVQQLYRKGWCGTFWLAPGDARAIRCQQRAAAPVRLVQSRQLKRPCRS